MHAITPVQGIQPEWPGMGVALLRPTWACWVLLGLVFQYSVTLSAVFLPKRSLDWASCGPRVSGISSYCRLCGWLQEVWEES